MKKVFTTDSSNNNHKLRIKILTLLSDLVIERHDVRDKADESSAARHVQYTDVDEKYSLGSQLREHDWCLVFSDVLVPDDHLDHDHTEKILTSLQSLLPECSDQLSRDSVIDLDLRLTYYRDQYSVLSEQETEDSDSDLFFTSILTSLQTVTSILQRSITKHQKHEL